MEQATPWYLLIGIALGCAMWAAGIAGTKQRSMLLFGGLGLMLGLFGVLIAYLVSSPEQKTPHAPFGYSGSR